MNRFDLGDGAVGLVESSTAVPLVSIVLAWKNGAALDPDDKQGLGRFTARMLRRGSEGLSSSDIENAIDTLGSEIGVDVGPSTISVHGQVIRRNLVPFIDLLARIIGKPTFPEDEHDRLKRETVAEILEARDSDRALASIALRRAMFEGHPYAKSAAGRASTIEKIEPADVLAAYKKRFIRADLIIGFAGAISEDEAKELGRRLANAIPAGTPTDLSYPEPPALSGRKLIFIDKPERTQTQIIISSMGTWPRDPDHIPLTLATAIFGGTFTSRMMREIRSKRGWSYGTSARLSIERKRHAFSMSAAPAAADCPPCIELELSMLEELVEKGINAKELAFIKNYLVRSHAFEVDTAGKRLGQALEVEMLDLPDDYHSKYLDHVKAATLEDANAALAKRLSPNDLYVVVVGTASEMLEKVRASIPRLASEAVLPFERD